MANKWPPYGRRISTLQTSSPTFINLIQLQCDQKAVVLVLARTPVHMTDMSMAAEFSDCVVVGTIYVNEAEPFQVVMEMKSVSNGFQA